MLGEFLGITGATALMMDIGTARLSRLCAILNNRLDVERLTKFKHELDYLDRFLSNLEEEYSSPDIRKMLRQAELVESGNVDRVKKLYDMDISGKSPEELATLSEKIKRSAKDLAVSMNVDTTVVNSFKLYKTGEVVRLGDLDLKVLANFKKKYQSNIPRYKSKLVEGSFEEVMAFGRRIKDLQTRSPRYLLNWVEGLFMQPGVNPQALAKQCLAWVSLMRSFFIDAEDKEEVKSLEDPERVFESSFDFSVFLLGREGKDRINNSVSDLSEKNRELLDIFTKESTNFEKIMRSLAIKESVDAVTIRALVETYFELFLLDHDSEYLSSILFPEDSGIVASKEEISGIYTRLASVGFFSLSFLNCKLMEDSLGKISFNVETKTQIDPDKGSPDYTLGLALEDIEYFCYSLRPMGSRLEEVI